MKNLLKLIFKKSIIHKLITNNGLFQYLKLNSLSKLENNLSKLEKNLSKLENNRSKLEKNLIKLENHIILYVAIEHRWKIHK